MDKSPFLDLEGGLAMYSDGQSSVKSDFVNGIENHQTNFNENHSNRVHNYVSNNSNEWPPESEAQTSNVNLYPPVVQAGSRFRGQKEVDINKWDEEAAERLNSIRRTPGDYCDCLKMCRRPFKMRTPPGFQKIKENVDNGYPLPRGIVWFVRDIPGFICVIITWLLIGYAEFVVALVLLPQFQSIVFSVITGIFYHIFAILAVASHLKCVFTDPGTIRLCNATKDAVMRIYIASGSNTPLVRCPKCLCIKPERTHHCSCCRRCVRKMDHHCPWVNNCVGEGNQKYFVLFNMYIFLMSITAIAMIVYYFVSCFTEFGNCGKLFTRLAHLPIKSNITHTRDLPSTFLCVGLGFESVLFGLFTMAIGCSQLGAICKDETAVESLKRDKTAREKLSRREALANVFGTPFTWRWCSPFSPPAQMTPIIPPVVDGLFVGNQNEGFAIDFTKMSFNSDSPTDSNQTIEMKQKSRDVYMV